MPFATIAEAIAFVEGFAVRPPHERETLPPTKRQAARLPFLRALLAELGDPQAGLRVAHVTGTSGKGSTATMLAAILRAAGQRVGLYTNPYVIAPQERVQIDGVFISDAEFIACAEQVAAALDRLRQRRPDAHPHLKQVWVALMLLAFRRARVDFAVVEVGMGGRFDETNVAHPCVALITNVGFDHTEFLGATLAEIAGHKAGIIKEGAPVVTGVTQPELLPILQHEAAPSGSTLAIMDRDFGVRFSPAPSAEEEGAGEYRLRHQEVTTRNGAAASPASAGWGQPFTYWDAHGDLPALHLALQGAHQAHNAALAIAAARQVLPTMTDGAIRAGLAQAWLPGRFEVVARLPTVVLDVAHNPDKMRALAETLPVSLRWERLWVVFGALGTKEIAPMLAALAPLQPHVIATLPTVAGRVAQSAQVIADQARAQGIADVRTEPDPHAAVELALAQAQPADVVLITGSLFLVSAVRHRWQHTSAP